MRNPDSEVDRALTIKPTIETMKKSTSTMIGMCCLLLCSYYGSAEDAEFDPGKIKAEYYEDAGVKDKLIFNDKGKMVGKSQYNMGKKIGKTQWYWDK